MFTPTKVCHGSGIGGDKEAKVSCNEKQEHGVTDSCPNFCTHLEGMIVGPAVEASRPGPPEGAYHILSQRGAQVSDAA